MELFNSSWINDQINTSQIKMQSEGVNFASGNSNQILWKSSLYPIQNKSDSFQMYKALITSNKLMMKIDLWV